MKKLFVIIILTVLCNSAKADDYDTVLNRLFTDYSSPTALSQYDIQQLANNQLSNGSWAGISYTQTTPGTAGWDPLKHLDNLVNMAVAYNKSGHYYYHDTFLKTQIRKGLLYWYSNPCTSTNWFDNDIAKQERFCKIFVLMKSSFSQAEYDVAIHPGCINYLILPTGYNSAASAGKRTPTNAAWLARNLVHHGVLEKQQDTLQHGINNMALQMAVQNLDVQGIQYDNSYLVHGLQLYNAGYGQSLISTVSYYMYIIRGLTLVSFSTANVNTLSDLTLEGDQWMTFGRIYDMSSAGREITRKGTRGFPSSSLKAVLDRLIVLDSAKTTQYQLMLNHLNGSTGATTGITGNKYFFRSDYMTHRRAGLFIGIKMCSSRTVGTECDLSENLLGHWLPFGATTIMRNTNEYYDIFGLWDWRKIPGVTNPEVLITFPTSSDVYVSHAGSFVGGVSNETNGVTGMNLNQDTIIGGVTIDITAKKANFLWNNEMICLGAGINSSYSAAPTTTTLNQSFLNGTVLVNGSSVPQQVSSYTNVRWIHHDSTGYVFRENTTAKMKTNSQSGNWYTINRSEDNATVTGNVFKLWLDHGTSPTSASYEYVVLPNYTSAQTSTYAADMPLITNSNTETLQSVTHKTLKQTGAVFYTAGTVFIDGGLKVAVDKACILLIDHSVSPLKITASDPTQTQTSLSVTVTYANNSSEILAFTLPSGNNTAGSSITKTAVSTLDMHGVWTKAATKWAYNSGTNTGTGQVGGTGLNTTPVTNTTTAPSTQGFMPYPASGSIALVNASTATGAWYLTGTTSASQIRYVSSNGGKVSKLAMYNMDDASSLTSVFYTLKFNTNTATTLDWRFAVGQGSSHMINTSGLPGATSTASFPSVFANVRWNLPAAGNDFNCTYTLKTANDETTAVTENSLSGITFSKGGTYNMEFYCNNSTASQTYVRNSLTYTVPSHSFHAWANGLRLYHSSATNVHLPGMQLTVSTNLNGIVWQGNSSVPASTSEVLVSNVVMTRVTTPVSMALTAFSGSTQNALVMLNWSALSGHEKANFEILRKTESSDFTAIGKIVAGAGSTQLTNHSYLDFNPVAGANFYQIKQVGNEGEIELSDIIKVHAQDNENSINVYVNESVRLIASVYSAFATDNANIRVTDVYGRVISDTKTKLAEGENTINLNTPYLIKGIYIATLIANGKKISTKFMN